MKRDRRRYEQGSQIRSLDVLFEQHIIFVKHWKQIKPIAFMQNLQAVILKRMIDQNQLFKARLIEKGE